MPTIYCSAKLASFIGNDRLTSVDKSSLTNPLAHFNAHLFYFGGRKCIIFTNKATLYTVVRLDVLKKDIKELGYFFQSSLKNQLKADNLFDEDKFWQPFFSEPVFCRTDNDKRVLGSMNDFIYQLTDAMAYGDLRLNLTDTNAGTNVNTLPMGMIGYISPIESLTKLKRNTSSPSHN